MNKSVRGEYIRTHREKKVYLGTTCRKIKVSENLIGNYEREITTSDRDEFFELSIVFDFLIDSLVKGIKYSNSSVFLEETSELFDKLPVSQRKIALITFKTMVKAMFEESSK